MSVNNCGKGTAKRSGTTGNSEVSKQNRKNLKDNERKEVSAETNSHEVQSSAPSQEFPPQEAVKRFMNLIEDKDFDVEDVTQILILEFKQAREDALKEVELLANTCTYICYPDKINKKEFLKRLERLREEGK